LHIAASRPAAGAENAASSKLDGTGHASDVGAHARPNGFERERGDPHASSASEHGGDKAAAKGTPSSQSTGSSRPPSEDVADAYSGHAIPSADEAHHYDLNGTRRSKADGAGAMVRGAKAEGGVHGRVADYHARAGALQEPGELPHARGSEERHAEPDGDRVHAVEALLETATKMLFATSKRAVSVAGMLCARAGKGKLAVAEAEAARRLLGEAQRLEGIANQVLESLTIMSSVCVRDVLFPDSVYDSYECSIHNILARLEVPQER
jgi:hypothetical protein